MPSFKYLELEDKASIEAYTLPYAPRNCDLAFANMFCWQAQFHTEWAVIDSFLVIRFRIGGSDKIGYMQPIGNGDFTPVLEKLDAERLIGLTPESVQQLKQNCPDCYAFDSNRDYEDYIYLTDDLRNLEGSRYKSKRNHINRFVAEYEYRFEPLTEERVGDCMELEKQWRLTKDMDVEAEERAMTLAFSNFERLGLRGGILYVKNRPVAFTYGSPINRDTFCIHVEKADTAFEGAFTMINREFLKTLPSEYRYVDREEDLGIEGLRTAKLSYHPAFLQQKFTALRLTEETRRCRQLWKDVFGDDDTFIDIFLVRFYEPERMRSVVEEGRLVAMLHLIPMETDQGPMTYI